MKSAIKFLMIFSVACLVLASCEGPRGQSGKDGVDGIDGANGTSSCIECHNSSAAILAKTEQYEHSQHGTGEESAYTNGRTSGDCQKCHSNQGFHEFLKGATGNVHQNFEDIQQPNCYTCHNIHQTFTSDDFELTTTASVTFMNGIGGPYKCTDHDGAGNLCANCRRARIASPAIPVVGSGNFTLASNATRWGPHYSSVSNIMTNTGGYNTTGTLAYNGNHPHKNLYGTTCHMAPPYGSQAGGHTMKLRYDSHGTEMILRQVVLPATHSRIRRRLLRHISLMLLSTIQDRRSTACLMNLKQSL